MNAHMSPFGGVLLLAVATASSFLQPGAVVAQNSSLLHRTRSSGNATPPWMSPQIRPTAVSPAQGMTAVQAPPTARMPLQPLQAPGTAAAIAGPEPGLTLEQTSWIYDPPRPLRTFAVHDLITIRVDEIARVMAEGNAENRKLSQFSAVLSDWIRLTRGRLRPDPQENGDPTVAGQTNGQFRAESSVDSRESMTFNITAEVVDIKPNGNLALEARKTFHVNDNSWTTALVGFCRAQDVGPDNVVLSRDMMGLEITKRDHGHLRDGYKRGWLTRALDRMNPF
ncbi:MAG: flagellar basal body L-ring protein FlgH [Planctomycetota bacterium]